MIGKSIFKRRASTRPPESTYVSSQTPDADAWPCVKGFRYLVQDKPAGTIGTDGFTDWNTKDDFFRFTRGRFVRNEAQEMSQRCVRFNMNELARLAAEAVGSHSCVNVEKYPDGMFNKAFLLTMQDGTQVVGKVPNPNAGRPHFTTASEVATMDFVRICSPFRKAHLTSCRLGMSWELQFLKYMPGAPKPMRIR